MLNASDLRKNLEYRCRDCEWCYGQGLPTIFHDRYDGLPYVQLKRHDGTSRKYAMRVAVPCVCNLGLWIRDQHEQEATHVKQLYLADVIEGRIPWTLFDPSAPPVDPDEPKTWAELNRRLADGERPGIRHVQPRFEGNRKQAYFEMGHSSPANGAPRDPKLSSRCRIDHAEESPY